MITLLEHPSLRGLLKTVTACRHPPLSHTTDSYIAPILNIDITNESNELADDVDLNSPSTTSFATNTALLFVFSIL